MIHDALKARRQSALDELEELIQDRKDFPINYNHYYTDTVHKKRQDRIKTQIEQHIPENFHSSTQRCSAGDHYPWVDVNRELARAVHRWADTVTPNMEKFSCEEALDCLLAIYKVSGTPLAPSLKHIYLLMIP